MRKLLENCFVIGGRISRMEYFVANIFIMFICLLWIFILFPIIFPLISGIESLFLSTFIATAPMLAVFNYASFFIILKRGRDFKVSMFTIYAFI